MTILHGRDVLKNPLQALSPINRVTSTTRFKKRITTVLMFYTSDGDFKVSSGEDVGLGSR